MTINDSLLKLLKEEMKPALGVTEPVAVALAAAKAYEAVKGTLHSIKIVLDPALFKNGVVCRIPGTDKTGFEMAAVLGVMKGIPGAGLEVLKNVDKKAVADAETFIKKGTIFISVKEGHVGVFVDVKVITSCGNGRAVIATKHDNIILIETNGKVKYSNKKKDKGKGTKHDFDKLKVADLIDFARSISYRDIKFVTDAVAMNVKLAKAGLKGKWGLCVGSKMSELVKRGDIASDLVTLSQIYVAAATDARLGGAKLPAMSIAGSGTHGITAMLPIYIVAKELHVKKEKMARAIALSLLITVFIKSFTGRLSAFCGCSCTAGAGAAAGIVFMLGGNETDICNSIMNMAADVTGIICDGANFGCSLKTSTGAGSALKAALLAMNGSVMPVNSGILGSTVEETIRNMGRVSAEGMVETDKTILRIITKQ